MWNRWTKEYVRGLRERHNLKHGDRKPSIAEGDVVLVQGEKDRNYWKLGIVKELYLVEMGLYEQQNYDVERGCWGVRYVGFIPIGAVM